MIKPAWSTPLFLRINSHTRRWPIVDYIMIFAAHYLGWILLFVLLRTWYLRGVLETQIVVFGSAFFLSLVVSYTIAYFWKQPRPVRRLEGITVLIRTFGTWKTFPSDHAIAATIFAYAGWQTFGTVVAVCFVFLALLIAISRVWVGVHYPRDILGGFFIASCVLALLS